MSDDELSVLYAQAVKNNQRDLATTIAEYSQNHARFLASLRGEIAPGQMPSAKALAGIGNPQGNLDNLAQHALMFRENTPVGLLIDFYLNTGDASAVPMILTYIEDERRFWLAAAGKSTETTPGEFVYSIKGMLPEQRITYGIVYRRDRLDHQREWTTRDIVEKAAHGYLKSYRYIDTEHSWQEGSGVPVESYLAPCEISVFFGKRLEPSDVINEGDWVLGVEWAEPEWGAVKSGEISGYSLGGFKRLKEGVAPP